MSEDQNAGVGQSYPHHRCSDWDDFVKYIRVHKNISGAHVLYRGQMDAAWSLTSPWDRWMMGIIDDQEIGSSNNEHLIQEKFLDRFKAAAIGMPGIETSGLSDNQWWALGRHHGLITPLLDWTESPYVAAYFAFADLAYSVNPNLYSGLRSLNLKEPDGSHEVAIWNLQYANYHDLPDLQFIRARHDRSHRQRAQRGYFTRIIPPQISGFSQPSPEPDYRSLDAYIVKRNMTVVLSKITIPGQAMRTALFDLNRMNITPATIFADLDGAAREANMHHIFQQQVQWNFPKALD